MPRPAIIVLRILAVGSALTILACQISNRQKQADSAAGDRGARGSAPADAKKAPRPEDYWAAGSKSARMVTPGQLKEPTPAQSAPTVPLPPVDPGPVVAPNPPPPAPAHTRGFGSKSAPLVTPSDLRQLRQQSTSQGTQQPQP